MNSYEKTKKARRIASILYLLIMAVIMAGTYLSEQQKLTKKDSQVSFQSKERFPVLPDTQFRN